MASKEKVCIKKWIIRLTQERSAAGPDLNSKKQKKKRNIRKKPTKKRMEDRLRLG